MQFFKISNTSFFSNLIIVVYYLFIIYIFPLFIDYMKTFFYLKNYSQYEYSNVPVLIISYLIICIVSFPLIVLYVIKGHFNLYKFDDNNYSQSKKKFFFKTSLIYCNFFSFLVFFIYSFYEIEKLSKSDLFYLDCKKTVQLLKNTENFNKLNIYVEHIPFLFWGTDNIDSRVLPLENSVKEISDLIILTDSSNDYFYLNREGLSYSKISDFLGVYSNSQSAIKILNEAGFSFSRSFFFEKNFSLRKISEHNKLDDLNKKFIVLNKQIPIIYTDLFLYTPGDYYFDIEIDKKDKNTYKDNKDKICFIELHLGRSVNKIELYENDFEDGRMNKTIQITLNSFEQGTFISIMSLVNSNISLESIKLRKMQTL